MFSFNFGSLWPLLAVVLAWLFLGGVFPLDWPL